MFVARLRQSLHSRAIAVVDPGGEGRTSTPIITQGRVAAHVALKIANRLVLVVTSQPSNPKARRRLRLVAVAFVCWDLWEARQLLRDERTRSIPRALTDTADLIWWGMRPEMTKGVRPITAVPLVIETSFRYGAPAIGLPVAQVVLAAIGARRCGRPARPSLQIATAAASIGGLGLRHLESSRADSIQMERLDRLASARNSLMKAGAHRVSRSLVEIDGHPENPHDVLSNARNPLLGRPIPEDSPFWEVALGGRKQTVHDDLLAGSGRGSADLFHVLGEWTGDQNMLLSRAALRRQLIGFDFVGATDSQVIITEQQAFQLRQLLAGLDLVGSVAVEVLEASRPGLRVILVVGGERLTIDSHRGPARIRWSDPSPAAAAVGAVWLLTDGLKGGGLSGASLRTVAPGAVAFAGLAAMSNSRIGQAGERAHRESIAASVVIGAWHAASVRRRMRGTLSRDDGLPMFAMYAPLKSMLAIAGLGWRSLSRGERAAFAIATAVLTAFDVRASRNAPRRNWMALEIAWSLAGFIAARWYRALSVSDSERLATRLPDLDGADEARIVDAGEAREWAVIAAACDDVLARFGDDELFIATGKAAQITQLLAHARRASNA